MPAPLWALLINGSKIGIIGSHGSAAREQGDKAWAAAYCAVLEAWVVDKLRICWIIQSIIRHNQAENITSSFVSN